jgi:hypothetical protein
MRPRNCRRCPVLLRLGTSPMEFQQTQTAGPSEGPGHSSSGTLRTPSNRWAALVECQCRTWDSSTTGSVDRQSGDVCLRSAANEFGHTKSGRQTNSVTSQSVSEGIALTRHNSTAHLAVTKTAVTSKREYSGSLFEYEVGSKTLCKHTRQYNRAVSKAQPRGHCGGSVPVSLFAS